MEGGRQGGGGGGRGRVWRKQRITIHFVAKLHPFKKRIKIIKTIKQAGVDEETTHLSLRGGGGVGGGRVGLGGLVRKIYA